MITLNHSVNLVTEIDENLMPDHLLSRFINLSETQMEELLRACFIDSVNSLGFLDKINEGNSWATLKFGENN